MKYIIRILASLPALCVELTALFMFVMSFDHHWLIVPAILNGFAMAILLDNLEYITRGLVDFIRLLCDTTPIYE